MLKIKLSRKGKKKHPIYRLIVSEVGRDPYGRILENLGSWDPHTKDLQVKADRVKHWIEHGAQMTDTINNLFIEKKIIEGKKVNVSALGKKAKEALKKSKEAAASTVASASAEATVDKKAMVDEKPVEAKEAPAESAPAAETVAEQEATDEPKEAAVKAVEVKEAPADKPEVAETTEAEVQTEVKE